MRTQLQVTLLSQTVDRVLINPNSQESDVALNDRMACVAVSRARKEATIDTDSKEDIAAALDRQIDKQGLLNLLMDVGWYSIQSYSKGLSL